MTLGTPCPLQWWMLLVFQLLFPHGIFRANPENISVSIKPYFCHINQHRLGHYDAVKPINLPTSTTTPQCCHRGINIIGQYSTRATKVDSHVLLFVDVKIVATLMDHALQLSTLKNRVCHKEEPRPPKPVCQFMEIKGEALHTGKWLSPCINARATIISHWERHKCQPWRPV